MVATRRLVRLATTGLNGLRRRVGGDEAVAARADRVGPPGFAQRLADHEVVLGLEELHQRPLHLAVPTILPVAPSAAGTRRRVPVAYSWLGLRLRGERGRLGGVRFTGLSG